MEILLIPGFMLDGDLWRDLRPDLAAFGDIVDVDTTQDNSIAAMARRAIAGMVDRGVDRAIVVGFSMGGYVAREIAYQAPGMVAGLALIATSSRGDNPNRIGQRSVAAAAVTGSGGGAFRRLSRAAVASSLHPDHRGDAMIARVQAMSERLGGGVPAHQSQIFREGDTDRLGEIACPTVIIAAAQDELRSLAESEAMRAGIASATMTVIENSGHLIPVEQPRELAKAMALLLEAMKD